MIGERSARHRVMVRRRPHNLKCGPRIARPNSAAPEEQRDALGQPCSGRRVLPPTPCNRNATTSKPSHCSNTQPFPPNKTPEPRKNRQQERRSSRASQRSAAANKALRGNETYHFQLNSLRFSCSNSGPSSAILATAGSLPGQPCSDLTTDPDSDQAGTARKASASLYGEAAERETAIERSDCIQLIIGLRKSGRAVPDRDCHDRIGCSGGGGEQLLNRLGILNRGWCNRLLVLLLAALAIGSTRALFAATTT